jgi:carbon storage regulator
MHQEKTMLVLSRKVGERIVLGEDIIVTVVRVEGGRVRIGIDAPADVSIYRPEMRRAKAPVPLLVGDTPANGHAEA